VHLNFKSIIYCQHGRTKNALFHNNSRVSQPETFPAFSQSPDSTEIQDLWQVHINPRASFIFAIMYLMPSKTAWRKCEKQSRDSLAHFIEIELKRKVNWSLQG
jgi:hypothetical protein